MGTNLAEELPRIYAREAAAVVVFVSADYAGRDWTRLERRAAFSQAVAEAGVYVLPARFDDSELPGLLPDVVAVDLRRYTPGQFADLVAAKLADLTISPSPGSAASSWSALARAAARQAAPACKGRLAGQKVQPRQISFTAARRAALDSTLSGAATASLPTAITAAMHHGTLHDLGKRRIVTGTGTGTATAKPKPGKPSPPPGATSPPALRPPRSASAGQPPPDRRGPPSPSPVPAPNPPDAESAARPGATPGPHPRPSLPATANPDDHAPPGTP